MDRRLFLLSGTAAAATAAPDPPQLLAPQSAPAADLPGYGAPSGDARFDAWKEGFIRRALAAGWPPALLDQGLKTATFNPRIVAHDTVQPEFSKPVSDYIKTAVSDERIAQGREFRDSLAWLPQVEQRFGVPKEILLGIWAMESAFGAIQGDFDVIEAVANLAASGRRRDWAERQVFDALRMLATTPIHRETMKGSWAGAMGQTQFIPETYLSTAVDFDGDGAKDIWGSSQDALASAANLLAKSGWRSGQGWHAEVILPTGFDYSLSDGPRQPWKAWSALGVRPVEGRNLSEADAAADAGLMLPAGAKGPAFLLLPNHFVIRRYNNSGAYALSVGLLADRFGGAGPLAAAWPEEPGMTLADRTGAQQALAKLGFDPGAPDGVIGTNTKMALKGWQKARGLPADGYLSNDMVQKLLTEISGQ